MRKHLWDRKKFRRVLAAALAALVATTIVVPSFSSGDEIHLINDLGGYGGGLSAEEEAERNWNEDLVSVAKSAWLDAHSAEDRERTEASPSVLARVREIPATGSELNRGENAPAYSNTYDVFADYDEGAAVSAVSSLITLAGPISISGRNRNSSPVFRFLQTALILPGSASSRGPIQSMLLIQQIRFPFLPKFFPARRVLFQQARSVHDAAPVKIRSQQLVNGIASR